MLQYMEYWDGFPVCIMLEKVTRLLAENNEALFSGIYDSYLDQLQNYRSCWALEFHCLIKQNVNMKYSEVLDSIFIKHEL